MGDAGAMTQKLISRKWKGDRESLFDRKLINTQIKYLEVKLKFKEENSKMLTGKAKRKVRMDAYEEASKELEMNTSNYKRYN